MNFTARIFLYQAPHVELLESWAHISGNMRESFCVASHLEPLFFEIPMRFIHAKNFSSSLDLQRRKSKLLEKLR